MRATTSLAGTSEISAPRDPLEQRGAGADAPNQSLWKSAIGIFRSHREVDLYVVRGIAILLAIGWHLSVVESRSRVKTCKCRVAN
jgi:hypothetical protein